MSTTAAAQKPLHILLTGGARGIGRGLFRHLLQRGHRVFMLDNNEAELEHVRATIGSKHTYNSLVVTACDLRQPAQLYAAVAHASRFFDGHLDVLINNAAHTAGVGGAHPASLHLDDWNAALETNLTAPMFLTQACYDMLKKKKKKDGEHGSREHGGTVINIASTRAHQSEPNSEPYAATKAGLIGLTHALAVSLAEEDITVNAILPGWIHVQNECKEADEKGMSWDEGLSNEDHRWHLTGRVGRVEDIYKAVRYLISARFVTGTELVVDGGVTRKMVYPEE